MKNRIKKLLIGFVIGFFILVLLRLTYLLVYEPYEVSQVQETVIKSPLNENSDSFGRIHNIATNTFQQLGITAGQAGQIVNTIVQKYEKIGYIDVTSTNFERDEKKLRNVIKKYNALNQYEQNTGLTGDRVLKLAIGVEPDKFDTVVKEVKTIGELTSFDVSTYDKTTEYHELQAKKASLETSRSSLEVLKQKGGNIDEYINLENRIMEVDTELQSLGVNIGDYDKSGNLCTIKFTISETRVKERIPVMVQTMSALEWTIIHYLLFVLTLLLASLVALIIIKIYEAFRASVKRNVDRTLDE